MTTSCGARSCFSIFPSCDRGPPTLPVAAASRRSPSESFQARHAKGQEAHFHCRNNSNLISTCSSLDSKAPDASSALFRCHSCQNGGLAELISNVPEIVAKLSDQIPSPRRYHDDRNVH